MPQHEKKLDQHLHLVPVSELGDTIKCEQREEIFADLAAVTSKGFRITPEVYNMATRVAATQEHCKAVNCEQREQICADLAALRPMATDYEFVDGLAYLWRNGSGWEGPRALTGDEDFLLPSFKKDSY